MDPSVAITIDMIRVVEGRCTAIECSIVEVPFRRSELSDEFRKIVPVFVIAVPAAFRRKVKLVPPHELSLRRQRNLTGFLIADQIATDGDERFAAFRPEGSHDIGSPRSQSKTGR